MKKYFYLYFKTITVIFVDKMLMVLILKDREKQGKLAGERK